MMPKKTRMTLTKTPTLLFTDDVDTEERPRNLFSPPALYSLAASTASDTELNEPNAENDPSVLFMRYDRSTMSQRIEQTY